MKKQQLRGLIRKLLKEQVGSGPGTPVSQGSVVGAKGCCKSLHLLKRSIEAYKDAVENIQQLIEEEMGNLENASGLWPFAGLFGQSVNEILEQISILENSVDINQQALIKAQNIFSAKKTSGCCKGGKY